MAYETVTKLEAAKRQLQVAIRLFFGRRDLVAVHTLAAAAQGVLYDLGRPRGLISIFKNNPLVRPEKREEMAKLFTEAQNFFKHADRDRDEQLKFYHETTKYYLLDAARLYIMLTNSQFPEVIVLQAWFAVKFPDLLVEGAFREQIEAVVARGVAVPDNYQFFLEMIDYFAG